MLLPGKQLPTMSNDWFFLQYQLVTVTELTAHHVQLQKSSARNPWAREKGRADPRNLCLQGTLQAQGSLGRNSQFFFSQLGTFTPGLFFFFFQLLNFNWNFKISSCRLSKLSKFLNSQTPLLT